MKIYRPLSASWMYLVGGFFIVLSVLTYSLYVETNLADNYRNAGLGAFWVFFLALAVIPPLIKVEVGNKVVKKYLFGYKYAEVTPATIKSMEYGNIKIGFYGSIRVLRIKISTQTVFKRLTMTEGYYGKDAIAHVMGELR